MKKIIKKLIILFLIIALLEGIAYMVYRTFFMPNSTVVPAFTEGRLNIIVEDELIENKGEPRFENNGLLLPLQLIRNHIDKYISWDAARHKLTVTTADKVVRMKAESLDAFVNNEPVTLSLPVTEENGEVFVPIEFFSGFYGLDIEYNKENNVIIIDFKNKTRRIAEPVKQKAVIRTGPSIFEPIVKKLDSMEGQDSRLRVIKEDDKWYKVRAFDGTIGYIEKKSVEVRTEPTDAAEKEKIAANPWKPENGKINMAWDYVYNVKFNPDKKTEISGLDVISPTWFQVVSEAGELKSHADIKYVEWAHEKGYKVWALFSNSMGGPAKTGSFLNNTDARDNAIRQLLSYADEYKLDGINIDFENLRDSDKGALTQFVRELSPLLREKGFVVSIDVNTLPCYDRKALGEAVDYVALMAYDQYWSGSSVAGSVSQVSWVDRIVGIFLKDIPAEKLILGVPFYARLWKETQVDGKLKLTSQALSMQGIENFLLENNAQKTWDAESGQYYSEFGKDGATYKVWLEDINSMNLRMSLVHKYELAGAAAWRLDLEKPEVWEVINHNLKVLKSYEAWKQQNDSQLFALYK